MNVNINYSQINLNIIYKGKITKILTSSLQEIDKYTGKTLSKVDLLNTLSKDTTLDKNSSNNIELIINSFPSNIYSYEDCNDFTFILTAKSNKEEIVLPVLYGAFSYDNKEIYNELSKSNKLYSILAVYLNRTETDDKNRFIIQDILSYKEKLDNENIEDELSYYLVLDNKLKQGELLDKDDYDYLKQMKNKLYMYETRRKLLNKLVKNIDQSHYKKRTLLSITKLFNNDQPQENEIILNSESNKLIDLKCILEENTIQEKRERL